MRDLNFHENRSLRKHNECPFCKGTKFKLGPRGGLARNFFCANHDCEAGFNYLGSLPMQLIQEPKAVTKMKEAA